MPAEMLPQSGSRPVAWSRSVEHPDQGSRSPQALSDARGYDPARPEWRNWQTRGTQNPVSFGTCGFDPHLRHRRKASGHAESVLRPRSRIARESREGNTEGNTPTSARARVTAPRHRRIVLPVLANTAHPSRARSTTTSSARSQRTRIAGNGKFGSGRPRPRRCPCRPQRSPALGTDTEVEEARFESRCLWYRRDRCRRTPVRWRP